MTTAGATWAGTHTFTAPSIVEARSIDEVVAAVAGTRGNIRALGTRHSFTDLADTTGTLVTVTDVPAEPELDAAARTVTVGAGTRYGVLAAWLQKRGWALHNLGSLPHISIAGATATATHGSGVGNGCLSTAIAALTYVDADADLVTVGRGEPDFPALAVGLGAFGIVVRVTLDIQPTYDVRQDVYRGIAWEDFLTAPGDILEAAYSVSVFARWTEPTLEQVWVKSRIGPDRTPPDAWVGGRRAAASDAALVDADPAILTPQGGTSGPWLERLPHFRLDSRPSNGDEIQSEYFVDRADASEALRALRSVGDLIDPLLLVTELRTVAADALWLSGAYDRDTLALHFTWRNDPAGVWRVLGAVEAVVKPWGARPHWGKFHAFDADRIAAVHPRVADARAVYERRDPQGRFANDHLRRIGVR